MAKRRANGEGNIRKRKDGRWEGRYTAGYDPATGKRITKNVLGKTQAEVKEKLQRAIELAIEYDIAIQYDETAQSPFFHYTDSSGTVHEVWFEDARSLAAKLRLIAEYGFQGAGFWNLMRPFSQTWLTLASLYDMA